MGLKNTFKKGIEALQQGANDAAEAVKQAKDSGALDVAADKADAAVKKGAAAAKKGVGTVTGFIKGFKG